jgi:hypothetical protein
MVVDEVAELLGRKVGGEEVEPLRASGTFFQDGGVKSRSFRLSHIISIG